MPVQLMNGISPSTHCEVSGTTINGIPHQKNHPVEGQATGGIQWAGEFHPERCNFRRKKDLLGNWINVCFRP